MKGLAQNRTAKRWLIPSQVGRSYSSLAHLSMFPQDPRFLLYPSSETSCTPSAFPRLIKPQFSGGTIHKGWGWKRIISIRPVGKPPV